MALDPRKCAEEIAANAGGGPDVVSAVHCATRLRRGTADSGEGKRDEAPAAAPATEAPTTSVIRCANGTVLQPVKGAVIPYDQIPDDTFASGVLGVGVGVQPTDEVVVAPFDGEVTSVAESKHAVGVSANGMELLLHVGVDTVNMNGDGFACLVSEGDKVVAGQPLIRFSREKIRAAGYSDTVAVLLTNSDDLENVEFGAKEWL